MGMTGAMGMRVMRAPQCAVRARSATMGAGPRAIRGIQIGPRIRVGGTLGKVGQNIKNTVTSAASNPLVQAGLGVLTGGATIPLLVGAAGKAIGTPHAGVGDAVKGAVQGYASGTAGNTVDDFLHSMLGGGSGAPGESAGGWMDTAKKLFSGGGADGQGSLGAIGDIAGKLTGGGGGSGGGMSPLDMLLMGGSVAAGAADKARQTGFQNKAADYATGDYDKNAGLRDQARSMITDRSTPDLSSIFANSGNVYDRARRGLPLGNRVPVASTY